MNFEVKQLSQRRKVLIPYIVRKDGNAFNMRNFSLIIDLPLLDIHGVLIPVLCDNLYLSKIPGTKKLIYINIEMKLTAISDFKKKGEINPFFAQIAEIVSENNGLWSTEAEKYLLKNAKSI